MAESTALSRSIHGTSDTWRFMTARILSDLLSPAITGIPFLALAVMGSGVAGTYRYAVLYFLVAVPPPVLYVVWLVKTGRVTDFHLPARNERIGPFVVCLCSASCALFLLNYLAAPREFVLAILAAFIQTFALFLITLRWQISIHTATVAGLATFAILTLGNDAFVLALLVPAVAWARIYLGRHTLAQTVAGALLGPLSFIALFGLFGRVW
jgi:membrane-associated phospholipid phosphatase